MFPTPKKTEKVEAVTIVPQPVPEEPAKPVTSTTISLEALMTIRICLDQLERGSGASIGQREAVAFSGIKATNAALKKLGLSFEHGVFVPDGYYLDKLSGEIIQEGFKWNPVAKAPVPAHVPLVVKPNIVVKK